jgi:hypothetical protein
MTWNADEVFSFSNISAATAAFALRGGNYGITVHATFGGGSVVLQRLATDGVSWVNVITALTADGYANANLPSGTYRINVTTATAVYVDVVSTVTSL